MLTIKKINIEKFRSIEKCSISTSELTALVGANNSGKSSILRALNAFFNYEDEVENFILRKHEYTSKTRSSKIELVFELKPRRKKLSRRRIRIPRDLKEFYCTATNLFIVQLSHGKKSATYRYKKDGVYTTTSNDIISTIKKYIEYIFIPPARDHSKVKWQNDSLLHSLVHEFLKIETQSRDIFSPKFREAAKYLESHGLKKISKEIKDNYVLNHDFSFDIKYAKDLTYKEFLRNILFVITEKGLTHELKECGSGIQSVIAVALYHTLAKLKNKKLVIGIEEPETHLHPQAQKEFLSNLFKFTNNGQIFLTTHSSVIIDEIKHDQIVLFRKKNHRSRGFVTEVTSIKEDFWSKYDIEDFKYYQFHDYRNSDFFFSKFVILTESKTEAQVIDLILEKENWNLSLNSFSMVNLAGVDNFKFAYSIIKELNLPHLIVLDKDFFLPYLNDEFKNSVGTDGFPKYRDCLKNLSLVEIMIDSSLHRRQLCNHLLHNHTKALDLLEGYDCVCMQYTLELDLLRSRKGLECMASLLNKPGASSKELISDNPKAIKKIKNILKTVKDMTPRDYPRSYQRIKNILIKKLMRN